MKKSPLPVRFTLLLFLLIAAVLLSACESLTAQFQSPVERLRNEADRLLADQRTAEALLTYRQVVEQDPKNVPALLKLGQLYAAQGRLRLAYRFLFKAQVAQPQNAEVKTALGALPTPAPSNAPLKLLWNVELCDGEPTGFALGSGKVIVSFDTGKVISLDAADGKTNWMVTLPARISAPPAFFENRIWVGAQDGNLYALSPADGSMAWTFRTGAPIYAPPTPYKDFLLLASGDGNFYALNLVDGTARWKFETGSALHAQAAVANGVVFFGSNNGRLYALQVENGKPAWQYGFLTQGAVESPVVISGGRVFFGSGDSRLYCLEETTGGEYWRVSFSDAVYARPVLIGDTVYAASAGGSLAAVDTLTGKKRWEARAESALTSAPLIEGDTIYYTTSGDPKLYAVNRQTGAQLWQLDTGDWLVGSPQMANGILYLAGKDGSLLAYR